MFLKEPLVIIRTEDQKSVLDQAVNSLKTKLCHDNERHVDYVRLRMKAIKIKEYEKTAALMAVFSYDGQLL